MSDILQHLQVSIVVLLSRITEIHLSKFSLIFNFTLFPLRILDRLREEMTVLSGAFHCLGIWNNDYDVCKKHSLLFSFWYFLLFILFFCQTDKYLFSLPEFLQFLVFSARLIFILLKINHFAFSISCLVYVLSS